MKMKRVFSSLMALGLATTLAACGGNNEDANNADTSTDTGADNQAEDSTESTDDNQADTDTTEGEEQSDEDKQALEDFEKQTSDDTLVIGVGEMNGDFLSGWNNGADDVSVRKFLGIEGNNGYDTVVQDEAGQWIFNNQVLKEDPETVDNEDGSRTFTFKLQEDLKWSDGEPVTADDYIFEMLIFSHPSYIPVSGSTATGSDTLKGYAEYFAGEAAELEGVEKVSDYEFKATIDESFLPYFEEGYLSRFRPFPMHAVSEHLQIREDGKALVVEEGYEPTEEDKKDYETQIQKEIDRVNEEMEAAKAALEEGQELDAETQKTFDDEIADYEQRLGGEVDPTQLLIERAMLTIGNEYRLAPSVTPGPYKFVEFANNMVKLELNENYKGNFKGDKATIPNIILQTVNANIAVDLLENGDIDIWEAEATGGKIDQMKKAADEGKISINTFNRNGYGNLTFLTDRSATQYKEVRQAIAHLMDRNTFVQSFAGGYGVVTNGMYGSSQWMYQERGADVEAKLTNYQLNIDRANELLDQSPYKFESDGTTPWSKEKAAEAFEADPDGFDYYRYDENGKRLNVNQYGSEESEITTLISNQLPVNAKQVGMEYNVTAGSFATLLDLYYSPEEDPEYSAFNMGSNFGTPFDPYYQYNSEGFNNTTKTNDPVADDITVRLRQTDPDDREGYLDTWEEFQVWYNDYLPEIPLYSNQYHTGYVNRVKGFDVNTPVWEAHDQINAMSLE